MRNILIIALILSLFLIHSVSSLNIVYNFNSTFEGITMFAEDSIDSNLDDNAPPDNGPRYNGDGSSTIVDITSSAGLDSNDGTFEGTICGSDDTCWQTFYSTPSISGNDITGINWTIHTGCAGGCSTETVRIYHWNDSSSSWVSCGTSTSTESIIQCSEQTTPSDFINGSGNIHSIVFLNTGNSKTIQTDFVQLNITYIPTVTVNLSSPLDLSSSNALTNNFVCNSSVSSEDTLNGVNLTIWNNDGTINGSNYTVISGTTNSTNLSYTFLSDGTYKWNCNVNSTSGSSAYATSNRTLTISTDAPAITLDYPSNNTYFNTRNNIYLNYTAIDSNGLSTCEVWGDWTGTWHKNSTNISVISGSQDFIHINVSSDRVNLWNVWCNDTTNSAQFSTNNFTFTTDTVYPTILVENITTTDGSQTFTFDVLATDTNLNNCFYTIYNSTGGVDQSTTANDSVSCTANDQSETPSAFGTYNLTVYSNDSAGNLNSSTSEFTLSEATSDTSSGGGGGENLVPVIALKLISSDTFALVPTGLTELQRAILYSKIRESCLNNSDLDNCLLTLEEKNTLLESLKNEGITLKIEELDAYIEQFNNGEVEEIQVSESQADTYSLFKSTLQVIESDFSISPNKLTPFFLVTSINSEYNQIIKSNRVLKSVTFEGELGFDTELTSSTTALVTYKVQSLDFSAKTFKATINYIAEDGSSVFQEVEIRAIYIFNQTVIIITILVVGIMVYFSLRKKK